jgi:hypothetical protein
MMGASMTKRPRPHDPRRHARDRRALARGVVLDLPPSGGAQRRTLARGIPVPAFGPRIVCTSCGLVGADARPNWSEKPARESLTGAQCR